MDTLVQLISDLHQDGNEAGNISPKDIIANVVSQAFSEELDQVDQDMVSNLLLGSPSSTPKSLLCYVTDNVSNKDKSHVEGRKDALKAIALYVKKKGSLVEMFGVDAFTSLSDHFKREEGCDQVKTEYIPVLMNLLRHCTFEPSSINLDKLFMDLFRELKTSKTKSQGLREGMFKLLGMLTYTFAESNIVMQQAPDLVKYAIKELEKNMNDTTAPSLSVIAGVFSCLDRCMLVNYGQNFVGKDLFTYVLKGVSSSTEEDTKRYAMARKSLRFLKNHAAKFQNLIGLNAETVYDLVNKCYRAEKDSLKKYSEDTLCMMLQQIACAVVLRYVLPIFHFLLIRLFSS